MHVCGLFFRLVILSIYHEKIIFVELVRRDKLERFLIINLVDSEKGCGFIITFNQKQRDHHCKQVWIGKFHNDITINLFMKMNRNDADVDIRLVFCFILWVISMTLMYLIYLADPWKFQNRFEIDCQCKCLFNHFDEISLHFNKIYSWKRCE